MVESGRGLPNFTRATPPISFSSSSKSWPKPSATSSSTQMAWEVTSGPIPSPGREVTRSCIKCSIRFRKDVSERINEDWPDGKTVSEYLHFFTEGEAPVEKLTAG